MSVVQVQYSSNLGAPAGVVWAYISVPESAVQCLPGFEVSNTDRDGELSIAATVELGVTVARLVGSVVVSPDEDSGRIALKGAASDGRRTKVRGEGTITVHETAPSATLLRVDLEVEVVGPLASFARTGGRAIALQMLADYSECLEETVSYGDQAKALWRSKVNAKDLSWAAKAWRLVVFLYRAFLRWAKGLIGNQEDLDDL